MNPDPPALRVRLLGPVEIEHNGERLQKMRSQKSLALIGYLVCQGQPVSRNRLAALGWGDQPDEAARNNLRWTLNNIAKLLPGCMNVTTQSVRFQPSPSVTVDVLQFEALLAEASEESLTHALDLYRGDFMEGLAPENAPELELWLVQERELWRQRVIDTFNTLIGQALAATNLYRGQRLLERLLALEPWCEESHRQLMTVLAHSGQRSAALAQYERCRRILREEVAADPQPETVALFERIRAGNIGDDFALKPLDGGLRRDQQPLAAHPQSQPQPPAANLLDWGEAPDRIHLYGRQMEKGRLQGWLLGERCRLVLILGMGGMGKTALAAAVARQVVGGFEAVLWRSLLNAPPLSEVVRGWVQALAGQPVTDWPGALDEQCALLFDQLRARRCLLILDNVESILSSGDRAGYARPGYEGYSQLILRMGQSQHQSCLLLTSREKPHEFLRLEGEDAPVHTLTLGGLDTAAGWELLAQRGIEGSLAQVKTLLARYSGNPLALKLVGETIQDFFGGEITTFLDDDTLIFDDIRDVLDQHFARLAPLEREVLIWLAIVREEITLQQLQPLLAPAPAKRELLEALRSLERRALLEKSEHGFRLQNVITEYATDYLVDEVVRELETGVLHLLHSHALHQTQAKEYVRQTQVRLIVQPIGERLAQRLGAAALPGRVKQLLTVVRADAESDPQRRLSYAGGNLLTLLFELGWEVRGYDCSRLMIRQVYFRGRQARDIDFSGAELAECTFSDTFGFISAVAFSPDGRLVAAATGDYTVRLWQVSNGEPWATLTGHSHYVESVAFSPDGRLLASCGNDRIICLWDLTQAGDSIPNMVPVRKILPGQSGVLFSVAFSLDGQWLASAGDDQTIWLWALGKNTLPDALPVALRGHGAVIQQVVFHPHGEIVVSAGHDGRIALWDRKRGQLVTFLYGHTQAVRSLAFSHDGQFLVSGSFDQTLRLWRIQPATDSDSLVNGELVQTLAGHTRRIYAIALHPDGVTVASGGDDQGIRLWNLESGQTIQTLHEQTGRLYSLAFNPDGNTLASGSDDQTLRLWDLRRGQRDQRTVHAQLRQTLQGYTRWLWGIAFNPDGSLLAAASEDQTIQIWDLQRGELRQLLYGHTQRVFGIAFTPDGQRLASVSDDQTVRLWDAATGAVDEILHGHTSGIRCAAFSPDGQTLATGSSMNLIRLWQVGRRKQGRQQQVLAQHSSRIFAIAFHPDGQLLASASDDHTVRLWGLRGRQASSVEADLPARVLQRSTQRIATVAFSPDGALLASAGADQVIRLWQVREWDAAGEEAPAPVQTLSGHNGYIWSVAFSPDGKTLASGSADHTVRLWQLDTGHCQLLEGHAGDVYSVAFSPDGATLASAGIDETIKLWDLAPGATIGSGVVTLKAPGPYEGMKITGITGLTAAQKATLKALGAVEV